MDEGSLFNAGRDGTLANHQDTFKVDAMTSFEALIAGGDKRKEILLRRSNANLGSIMADIVKEMLQHKLAAIHYEHTNNYLLFLPTMGFTLLSAIIAIFGTSEIVKGTDTKVMLGIIVSVLQLGLSVLYVQLCILKSTQFVVRSLTLSFCTVTVFAVNLFHSNSIIVHELVFTYLAPELCQNCIKLPHILTMKPGTKL